MATKGISYAQLLETNNLIQSLSDETYWLGVTRTVEEFQAFSGFRLPAAVDRHGVLPMASTAAKDRNTIGRGGYRRPLPQRSDEGSESLDRRRVGEPVSPGAGMADQHGSPASPGCCRGHYLPARLPKAFPAFLPPQRRTHQQQGIRPSRANSSERQLQVFHADMHDCAVGEPLHEAAQSFLAAASQYGFLISCESRVSMQNTGPYKLADDREMIIRDFRDLSENGLLWQDGVARDVPYNNLTVVMAVKDCHFHLIDDWGSFESQPEFTSEHLVGAAFILRIFCRTALSRWEWAQSTS